MLTTDAFREFVGGDIYAIRAYAALYLIIHSDSDFIQSNRGGKSLARAATNRAPWRVQREQLRHP